MNAVGYVRHNPVLFFVVPHSVTPKIYITPAQTDIDRRPHTVVYIHVFKIDITACDNLNITLYIWRVISWFDIICMISCVYRQSVAGRCLGHSALVCHCQVIEPALNMVNRVNAAYVIVTAPFDSVLNGVYYRCVPPRVSFIAFPEMLCPFV